MRENDRHNGLHIPIYIYYYACTKFPIVIRQSYGPLKNSFSPCAYMVFKLVPKNLTPLHKITPSYAPGVRRIIHRNALLCNRPRIILYIFYYYLYNMRTQIRGLSFRSQMTTAAGCRSVFLCDLTSPQTIYIRCTEKA